MDTSSQENKQILNPQSPPDNEKRASEIWNRFLELFGHTISEIKMNTWFRPIKPISLSENILTISFPSTDYCERIVSRFGVVLNKAALSILGDNGKLEYEIDSSLPYYEPEIKTGSAQKIPDPAISVVIDSGESYHPSRCYLNQDYFEFPRC